MKSEEHKYAVSPFICPRCEKPAGILIAGICPNCKKLIEEQLGKDIKKSPKGDEPAEGHKVLSGAYFDEHGTRTQSTADNMEGENLIHALCAEFGVNFNLATEVIAFVQQHSTSPHNSAAEQRFLEWLERDKAATARGLNYPGDVRMYLRMMALRKGYYDIAGGDGVVSVSKKCGTKKHPVSKATGQKCFRAVEDAMNLLQYPPMPLLPNQRTPAQKKTISEALKKSWHPDKPYTEEISNADLSDRAGDGGRA